MRASFGLLRAMSALPAPHQIIEHVGVQVGAVGALALLLQVLAVREQLGAAGGLGQKLHAAGPLELQGEPDRLLDAAAGGDDAVVAEKTGTPARKIEPSLPTGRSGRPSVENATACAGWVCTTAAMSGRTRRISEW